MSMAEVPVPARFLGCSLGSLDIRNHFQVSVLLVKRRGDSGEMIVDDLPGADFVFHEGDVMLVLGHENRISRFERNG